MAAQTVARARGQQDGQTDGHVDGQESDDVASGKPCERSLHHCKLI